MPVAIRRELTDILFSRFVTSDQLAFAAELYMSPAQLKTMVRLGQYVGSHRARHHRLNKHDTAEQTEDIDEALSFLKDLGTPIENWLRCYP